MSYTNHAPILIKLGYDTTPCKGKKPYLNEWQTRPETALEFDQHPNANIGIVLGGPNNIIGIDIDVLFEPEASIIQGWIDDNLPAMPERIGHAPKRLYVARSEGERSKLTSANFVKVNTETGEIECDASGKEINIAVEVLAEGQQFISSGFHPDTKKKYTWPNDSILDYRAAELPVIPDALLSEFIAFSECVLDKRFVRPEAVINTNAGAEKANRDFGQVEFNDAPPLDTIRDALSFISADEYDRWITVGLALKDGYGDEALPLWEEWSASSKNYETDGKNSCSEKWKTFKPPPPGKRRVSVGSILYLAGNAGWDKETSQTAAGITAVGAVGKKILSSGEFVAGFVAPDYLIDGIVQRRYFYSLTARTGDGKTAVLLTLAACTAQGEAFGDSDTTLGRVCYFAGENPDDVRARWLLMAEVLNFDANSIDVHFIDGTFNIPELFNQIAEEGYKVGGFDLVIVDTSAAYFQGDDENANVQLGRHARELRRLTTLPGGPCVIVACHPTKNPSRDNLLPRGGGAFVAEVDGNLTLWSDDKVATEMHWAGKFRGPQFEPISFKMEVRTVETVKDSKGRPMPSVVALPVTDADAQDQLAKTIRDEDAVLQAMLDNPSASMAQIAQELGWLTAKTNLPLKSKVERAIQSLKDDKLVKKHRKKWRLTNQGKEEAEEISRKNKQGFLP